MIKGSVRQIFYKGTDGYKIGIFKINETDEEDLKDKIKQTITFTGNFGDLISDRIYTFNGNYIYKEKYGYEYRVASYQLEEPKGEEAVIDFLSSSLIKGCGKKTAEKIVKLLGENALEIIKENPNALISIKGLTAIKAKKIYDSIIEYASTDELIINLEKLGFTVKESLKIISKFGNDSIDYLKENIYQIKDLIDFNKLDQIYLNKFGEEFDELRVKNCILKSFELLSFQEGSIYFTLQELFNYNATKYLINIDLNLFEENIFKLTEERLIIKINNNYYLKEHYDDEDEISKIIYNYIKNKKTNYIAVNEEIEYLEDDIEVSYNEEQQLAIERALNNHISIITGGPGTGKTTIINAIVKIYCTINDLSYIDMPRDIALLAPTGRASRKLSEVTGLGAMTIHRYLKWNKEKDEFQINETNKHNHKLIIVDEVSMIDMFLFKALLLGIRQKVTLVLVGDANQLPSVGAGDVLSDLIESNLIPFTPLKQIYRQTQNSYIPILAEEIRQKKLGDFTKQKDDYNFLKVNSNKLLSTITQIVEKSKEKGINENQLQILAPIYRGINGIDNLNIILRDIYNPKTPKKNEISYYGVIYREGDKIIQLVNDPDINVFNGDIGFIKKITLSNKIAIVINFEGMSVEITKEELKNIKHAYAITIHKSQGSEFQNVLIPISTQYGNMLYNKLLYTGVSRAKKSLVIIGEEDIFSKSIKNNYSQNRKTSLISKLMNKM